MNLDIFDQLAPSALSIRFYLDPDSQKKQFSCGRVCSKYIFVKMAQNSSNFWLRAIRRHLRSFLEPTFFYLFGADIRIFVMYNFLSVLASVFALVKFYVYVKKHKLLITFDWGPQDDFRDYFKGYIFLPFGGWNLMMFGFSFVYTGSFVGSKIYSAWKNK